MDEAVKLYELVGELVSDLAYARLVSDKHSCMISEKYLADPYMNGLPVPHFTISQAEISLPVMIAGVETDKIDYDKLKDSITDITKKKGGKILFDYVAEAVSKSAKAKIGRGKVSWEDERAEAAESFNDEENTAARKKSERGMLKKYAGSCGEIIQKLIVNINDYMLRNNSHTFKTIDLADAMSKGLSGMLQEEFNGYEEDERPELTIKNWRKISEMFRAVMINEYDKLFKLQSYIIVNPNTGRLNEFANNQLITNIKLVIKEQDMELTVKKNSEGSDVVRSLSLY